MKCISGFVTIGLTLILTGCSAESVETLDPQTELAGPSDYSGETEAYSDEPEENILNNRFLA